MKNTVHILLAIVCLNASPGAFAAQVDFLEEAPDLSNYADLYQQHCAVCHGEHLQGAAQGVPLKGVDLKHGDTVGDIADNIAGGFPSLGMPAWSQTLSEQDIKSIALYVSETRLNLDYGDFKYNAAISLPEGPVDSELHTFTVTTLIDGLDPLPFSIEPMPDGSLLLVEKKYGLSVISADGKRSDYITGTPPTFADTYILAVDQEWGNGWMLEAALHPDYEENGWVYLQYGERCEGCNEMSRAMDRPVSMNKLIRGRIRDGAWVDEEVIWESDLEFYGPMTDLAGGGRIAFDDTGHVFISVGMKGFDNHTGVQDLRTPWGKIHRVHDDGRIPLDNPFIETEGAMKSIWTYGHRSPQGLEYQRASGALWGTEHGPRGGDEINLLLPGRNYGWPLYSLGVNYDGTPVDYGKTLGIEFDLKDIQQPVVDLSPSPAVSSFIFYDGKAFPQWQGDIIVGSLKAQSLYRVILDDNKAVHRETLIANLARIRDIEIGDDGQIYLLLENNNGGMIVTMQPLAKTVVSR
jgi:glucose/arabinose dehydrogenase/cytochrome c553